MKSRTSTGGGGAWRRQASGPSARDESAYESVTCSTAGPVASFGPTAYEVTATSVKQSLSTAPATAQASRSVRKCTRASPAARSRAEFGSTARVSTSPHVLPAGATEISPAAANGAPETGPNTAAPNVTVARAAPGTAPQRNTTPSARHVRSLIAC